MKTKRCSKCGEVKGVDEFHKNRSGKDGLGGHCKFCKKAYREANREKALAYARAYQEANREKIATRRKAYREANREKIAALKKAQYEANRERILARQKAYRGANRERILASANAYYEANREKVLAYCKDYRNANPAKVAAYNKARCEALADGFVRTTIKKQAGIESADIPAEMIELKRQQIKLYRELKKGRKVLNEFS